MVHFAGLVLLMALMVIVMANDIKNIIFYINEQTDKLIQVYSISNVKM